MIIVLSSDLNNYMSVGQRDLINEGNEVLTHMADYTHGEFHDYSFMVFPFAKAYEGFLKQALLDVGFINEHDYFSTHFRIGKVMSPNFVDRLGNKSIYQKICDRYNCEIGEKIWETWKSGRNEIFHYFPHNLRSITFAEAKEVINQIIANMEMVVREFQLAKLKKSQTNPK